jgi:RNA polymerase sigma-70 factor (ECF subfamily)
MKVKAIYDEHDLLIRLSKQDEKAFRQLYDNYRQKVYTFALRMLSSPEQAEEVMQETFLRLWKIKEKAADIKTLEAYLKATSRNLSLNQIRRREIEARADEHLTRSWQEMHNNTEELILINDSRKLLDQGMASLPARQKLVYQLCQQQGLSCEEAAAQLNLSPLTVKSHLQRAIRFLRDYLGKHPDMAVLFILYGLRK